MDAIQKNRLSKLELAEVLNNLKAKHIRFAEEWVIDLNGKQAALRAGYAKSSAATQAVRLMMNDNVMKYIRHLQSIASEGTGITAQRIISEYKKVAFADLSDLFEVFPDGTIRVKGLDEMKHPEILKDIEVGPLGVVKIKLHDKLKALQDLGRHVGLFTDNFNLTNNGGDLPQTVVNININHRKPGTKIKK